MSKRVLAMALAILAFFIFVGSPFGQSAKAIAGVDDAIIAIIIAALAAMGMTFVVSSSYGSLEAYVSDLIEEYAEFRNMTPQQLFKGVNVGSNKVGQLLLNNRFVVVIEGFAIWLISKFSIQDNSVTVLQAPGSTLDGYDVYLTPVVVRLYNPTANESHTEYVVIDSSDPCYIAFGQTAADRVEVLAFAESALTVRRNQVGPTGNSQVVYEVTLARDGIPSATYPVTAYYYAGIIPYELNTSNFDITPYQVYPYSQIRNAVRTATGVESTDTALEIHSGTIELPSDNADYTTGDGAILDVDGDWGATYTDLTDGVIPGEFSGGLTGEAEITYTDEGEISSQVEDTPAQVISQNPSSYQTPGLESVFPFCIPFDIYAFFECLAAEPEAPSFTWRFYIPGICDEEIEIDLAAFDSAARILRTMELLAFIVGLAFVTRDKFLRG